MGSNPTLSAIALWSGPNTWVTQVCLHGELLGQELVTRTVHRSNVHGSGRLLFQFLPQPKDVVVDGSSEGIIVAAPHFIKELVA